MISCHLLKVIFNYTILFSKKISFGFINKSKYRKKKKKINLYLEKNGLN